MLGKVFAADKTLRHRCVLATKGGIIPGVPYDQSSAVLRKSCEDSLRRMGIDRIDLYFIHRPDLFAHPAEVAEVLTELRNEGKIAEVGVSNFTVAQYDALASFLPFKIAASQPEYSAANLGPLRDGTFDSCMRHGVIPFAWSPLAGGRLLSGDSIRSELITALDEIADRNSTTREAICYAFILSHPSRPIILLGSQRPDRIASAINNPLRELPKDDLYKIIVASEGKDLP
jgi:predicted oxidoreductase